MLKCPSRRPIGFGGIAVALSMMAPVSAGASDSPADLLWPLPIRPAVSSNFCEYRPGHLHAGLDIRTFGREGVPCRASGDGFVSRIRASSHAYGLAVYLQLETGQTLVYAHLSEFAPELANAVREEQANRLRYRVDLRFPPGRFSVERGDVIGYTGMTGATAPHLHFEVRNAREHPLDPFSNGFSLTDTMPPEFASLRILPLDAEARIGGICFPVELQPTRTGVGQYALEDTLQLSGRVGLSVRVFDRLNGESGRLTPHTIETTVDDTRVSSIRFDRFSFNHTDQVDFVYEIERIRSRKQYYFLLFRRAGETLWDRDFDSRGGVIAPAVSGPGPHRVVITVRDRAGNEVTLRFFFRRNGNGGMSGGTERSAAGGELDGFYFFEDVVSVFPGTAVPGQEWVRRFGDPPDRGCPIVATADSLDAVPAPLVVDDGTGPAKVYLVGLPGGETRSVHFSELDLELTVGERTFYTDQVVYATEWQGLAALAGNSGLIERQRAVRVGPYAIAMRADMEIRFTGQDYDTTDAVYRLNERGLEWVYYESARMDAAISTTARRPGVYAVFSDRKGPGVGRPQIAERRSHATGESISQLVVRLEDDGSGVDDERSAIYIAGVRQIARWDFVSKKMFVELRDANIMGRQAVSIVAYDQIGNRSQLDATVDIPSTR